MIRYLADKENEIREIMKISYRYRKTFTERFTKNTKITILPTMILRVAVAACKIRKVAIPSMTSRMTTTRMMMKIIVASNSRLR